jgi:FkbM family methyltransferase
MILEVMSSSTSGIDYATTYRQYLQRSNLSLSQEIGSKINEILNATPWEDPQSGLDWNNCGVVALIEASNSQDPSERGMFLEMAISAFEQGRQEHPLCHTHLALIFALIGETQKAMSSALSYLLGLLQLEHSPNPPEVPPGLVYLPASAHPPQSTQAELLNQLLTVNGYQQCSFFLSEVLLRSQMVFYNPTGLRLLHLAAQLLPHLATINLRLGISCLTNHQREGMLFLHRAAKATPDDYTINMALSIAYQDGGQLEAAKTWQEQARKNSQVTPNTLVGDEQRRYVIYDDLWIAVESSFRSIVTAVLIAEGDWFERELEFWRTQIQPGMVVIDVGANVGVYTFSAAKRVGKEGCVIAVEPFSGCVANLQKTCDVNNLEQVKVYRGAASDKAGNIYLSLAAASELNEVVTDPEQARNGNYEEAPCFTLDSICEKENLSTVDFLKIDAEGHELQVLMGSQQLLEKFSPVILYENIAGSHGSNLEVAEYLQKIGYQLFRYQPYLQQLIPVENIVDFQGSLNLIAMRSV